MHKGRPRPSGAPSANDGLGPAAVPDASDGGARPPSPRTLSSVFPFRLNRRKTIDGRSSTKSSHNPASSPTSIDIVSLDASGQTDQLSNKSRIRDIFAIPTHKPTGVLPWSGFPALSSADGTTANGASGDDDEDDVNLPRVGRPSPLTGPAPFVSGAVPPGTTLSQTPLTSPHPYPPHSTWIDAGPKLVVPRQPQPPPAPVSTMFSPMSPPPAYSAPPSKVRAQQQRRLEPALQMSSGEATSSANSTARPPPQGQGRFPRWKGWLEKRALERHMERAAQNHEEGVRRKKSWGAALSDPDAIDDEERVADSDNTDEDGPRNVPPPLHSHQFGSRFLPHLPYQPLCAVYLDVPRAVDPAAGLNTRRRPLDGPRGRTVLLIGTSDGLFAIEHRRSTNSATTSSNAKEKAPSENGWNQDIRCTQVWKGLGVYQLSILRPTEHDDQLTSPRNSGIPWLGNRSGTTGSDLSQSGIMLGLCNDPSRRSHAKTSALNRLSTHTHTAVEYAPQSFAGPSTNSLGSVAGTSSNRNSTAFDEPISSSSFGPGAGGGVGKAVPPGGAGLVKMWNLEAVRRVVAYTVNEQVEPLNLAPSTHSRSSSAFSGALRLPAMLRGAWATLSDPRGSSPSEKRQSRRAESDSYGVTTPYKPPSPSAAAYNGRASYHQRPAKSPIERSSLDSQRSLEHDRKSPASPRDSEHEAATERHAQALRLAQASVSINASTGTLNHQKRESSDIPNPLQSLFAGSDEGPSDTPVGPVASRDSQATSIAGASSTHGHGTSSSHHQGKGCMFFAVYESPIGFKAAGTWYLALASSRGILVYEATSPRKTGSSRTWSFLKELYTPLPPKAMAFVPASTAARDPSVTTARPTHARMSSSSRFSLAEEHLKTTSGERPSRHMRTGTVPSANILTPQHGLGPAGPAAWNGADLSLFVSFGRRAVMIRLSDAHVREIDLASGPLPSTADPLRSGSPYSDTARPDAEGTLSTHAYDTVKQHRKRPSSESGRILLNAAIVGSSTQGGGGAASAAGASTGATHSPTAERLKTKANQYWTGLQHVEARLTVRQSADEAESARSEHFHLPPAMTAKPLVGGVPMMPSASDSAADRGPGKMPHVALDEGDDDSSDDSDGYEEPMGSSRRAASGGGADFPGVTLYDRSIRAHRRGSASDSNIVTNASQTMAAAQATATASMARQASRHSQPSKSKSRLPDTVRGPSNTFQLTANVALLSRGSTTLVLPYPLPADMVNPLTLDILQWSGVPKAVTGWSRILGVEQTMSAGPLSTSALGARHSRIGSPPTIATTAGKIRLKVSLTVMAFLQYRVETQRVTIDVDITRPWGMEPNVELHLCPPDVVDKNVEQQPILDASIRPTLSEDRRSAAVDLEYPTGFVIPSPHVGGCISRTLLGDDKPRKEAGLSLPAGKVGITPFEAVGDGGAWAFSYRGGEDHRIAYFGAEV